MTADADLASHPDTRKAQLVQALLELYAKQADRTWMPILLFVSVIVWMAQERTPTALLACWLTLQMVAMAAVPLTFRLLPASTTDDAKRLRWVIITRGMRGLADATSVLLFPYLNDQTRLIQTMIYGVLCMGAVGSSAGYRPVFLAYAAPVMLSMILGWLLLPDASPDSHFGLWAALTMAGAVVGLVGLAQGHFRIFKSAVLAKHEQFLLNEQLMRTLAHAEAANAAKTRFLASASHDLRQPLHSLSLFFATLRLQIHSPDNLHLLGHIDQALYALQSQMNTLLDMSKLDAGLIKLNWHNLALRPVLEQLRTAYLPVAQEKGLQLQVNCSPTLVVNTDQEQLVRVLQNLLDNAVKYTQHGDIKLDAYDCGEHVNVCISDTGCGISEAMQLHVFEEFFQVDNPERDRNRGLGLGLSIVKRLAKLLYLELDLKSEPGQGTSVTLSIPRGTLKQGALPEQVARDTQPSMPMCSVLVLDDELAVRTGMEALLKHMGCEVMLASCIDEAMTQAARRQPDLVLADLRLRGTETGLQAVKMLRKEFGALPAIIITGDTAPDRLRQIQAAGLTVLHKPVAIDKLIQAIAMSLDAIA